MINKNLNVTARSAINFLIHGHRYKALCIDYTAFEVRAVIKMDMPQLIKPFYFPA